MERLTHTELAGLRALQNRTTEHATDALTLICAPTLPLIDWTQTGDETAPRRCERAFPRRAGADGADVERCDLERGHGLWDGHAAGSLRWCGAMRTGMENLIYCGRPPRHDGKHRDLISGDEWDQVAGE